MRLISRAAITVATCLTTPLMLGAQSVNLAAGASMPVGKTADAVNVGYVVAGGVGIKPPLAPLGLRIEAMYTQMEFKTSSFGKQNIFGGTANLTLSGAGMPLPMGYLIGGIGIYNASVSGGLASGSSSTKTGFNLGAGLNFPLTGFSTYLEARFHYVPVSGGDVKFIPITFGLKF